MRWRGVRGIYVLRAAFWNTNSFEREMVEKFTISIYCTRATCVISYWPYLKIILTVIDNIVDGFSPRFSVLGTGAGGFKISTINIFSKNIPQILIRFFKGISFYNLCIKEIALNSIINSSQNIYHLRRRVETCVGVCTTTPVPSQFSTIGHMNEFNTL